jgi:hypothetical protein
MTGAPTAVELARALGLRRAGGGWRGPCPCCGGDSRFSVNERDGKTLYFCWAGCRQGDVTLALRAAGAWPSPPERRAFTAAEKRAWRAARGEAEQFRAWLAGLEAWLRDSGGDAFQRYHLARRALVRCGLDSSALPVGALADACERDESWYTTCDRLRDYIARAPAGELVAVWRGLHQTRRAA